SVENRYAGLVAAVAGGAVANRMMTLDRRLSRLSVAANLTRVQTKELYADIEGASREFRIDPYEALSGIEVIMEKIGDLDFALNNKRNISMVIQATGADGASVGSVFTNLKKMGLETQEEMLQAIDILNMQGKSGAFTLQHLAQHGNEIFAAYAATGRTGLEAVRELGAAMQVINGATGSESQAVTSFSAFIRDVTLSAEKRKKLNQLGVDIFDPEQLKKGVEIMRPMPDIASDILTKGGEAAKNAGKTISDVLAWIGLESEALKVVNALRSGYLKDGEVKSFDQFMQVDGDGTTTMADAQKVAEDSRAAFQSLATALDNLARNELAEPMQKLADAVNSLDKEAVDNWMQTGKYIAYTVGTLLVARKALGVAKDLKVVFGKKGGQGQTGNDMGYGLGVMPVFVTNMGASFSTQSSLPDKSGKHDTGHDKGSAGSKLGGIAEKAGLLYAGYELTDLALDSLIGDTSFDKWAKNTTLGDLFPKSEPTNKYEDVINPQFSYLAGNYGQQPMQTNYPDYGGKLRVSVNTYHDGRPPKVGIDISQLPGATMED
ncbi:hypothetical protein VII00023_17449, partial [Vibrio ichthyoenteri ATCC 700023]